MNDELVRAQRAKEALEAEARRAALVSVVIDGCVCIVMLWDGEELGSG
jgi:aspartyl aminopeptidase